MMRVVLDFSSLEIIERRHTPRFSLYGSSAAEGGQAKAERDAALGRAWPAGMRVARSQDASA